MMQVGVVLTGTLKWSESRKRAGAPQCFDGSQRGAKPSVTRGQYCHFQSGSPVDGATLHANNGWGRRLPMLDRARIVRAWCQRRT